MTEDELNEIRERLFGVFIYLAAMGLILTAIY
jgi:hypothetical protein